MRRGLTIPEYLHPAWSLGLVAFVMAIDYALAPTTEFPALLFLPVLYGSWYGGLKWALPLSLIPFTHVASVWLRGSSDDVFVAVISATVRTMIMVPAGIWVAGVAASQRMLKQRIEALQNLLPICSYCKKIRDDAGKWQPVEKYIEERSEATFTHGVCELCLKEQEELWRKTS